MTEENLNPEGQPQDPAQEPEAAPEGTHGDPLAEAAEAVDVPEEAAAEPQPEAEAEEEDELTATKRALQERTLDLQRLQAEYVNYKKRVERDRELVRQNATYAALAPIIEVLDTIDRAREHGELEGGFKAVADQLEGIVSNLGLTRFGEPGDAFDPNIHEALTHLGTDAEVSVTTCQHIAKAGYRIADRVVRAAQVLVVDPA